MTRNVGHWIEEDGEPFLNSMSSYDQQFITGHPYTSGLINGHGSYDDNNMQPWVYYGELNLLLPNHGLDYVRFAAYYFFLDF